MFVTNLADVCRLSGLPVVEVPGWQTRSTEADGLTRLRGVCWHHTATAASARGDYPSLNLVRDGRGGDKPLRGPLSQLGYGRSATVYVIAAGQASHAGDGSWQGLLGNEDTLGIEMESPGVGDPDQLWTPAQRAGMPRLARALTVGLGIDPGLHFAHREWTRRKIDPTGVDMVELRRAARHLDLGEDDDMTPEDKRWLTEQLQAQRTWVDARLNQTDGLVRYLTQWTQDDRSLFLKGLAEAKAAGAVDDVDEALVVRGVLEGMAPGALAAAIPADLARQVADELGTRLAGEVPGR